MTHVTTVIRQDGRFVPLEEARPAKKPDHVEGAILLDMDAAELILDEELWDDVNWLWAFLVDAIDAVRAGRAHELMFAGQPITLKFTPKPGPGAWVRVDVKAKGLARGSSAPRAELVEAFKRGAIEFFEALPRLSPRNAGEADRLLKRVRAW